MIFTLVYVSSATRLLSSDQLTELLRVSRRNNEAAGITGMLLYRNGNLMQLLEGDEERVRARYAVIAEDRRHHGLITVWEHYEAARQFPDWTMAFRDVEGSSLAKDPGYAHFLTTPITQQHFGAQPSLGQDLLTMFKRFG